MKKLTVLSFGGGVQSTTIALMIHRGELPPVDAAVFADPGEESDATYAHIEWVKREVSFPIHVRTIGRLGDHLQTGRNGGRFAAIPAFQADVEGGENLGIGRRQCTKEYKTEVVERFIRRELLGLKPKQRIPKDVDVCQIIGLSFDEPTRVARVKRTFEESVKWARPWFPLFDSGITREGCVRWLEAYRVPHPVPRSACVFCPYRQNAEWLEMKQTDPKGWARAVEIDRALRIPGNVVNRKMERRMYIHRECIPLEQVDFVNPESGQVKRDKRFGQSTMSFDTECLGMCGS